MTKRGLTISILNYTTKIDSYRTIGEIQKLLGKAGASAVMHEMDGNGNIVALSFKIRLNENEVAFRLPTDWHPVYEVMKKDTKIPRRMVTQEQALRVAWRITKDWIEAQVAFIETMMVTLSQVFLPYAVMNDGKLLYQHMAENTHLLSSGS